MEMDETPALSMEALASSNTGIEVIFRYNSRLVNLKPSVQPPCIQLRE
jgi:hypothetical protein